jgi:hypothetical protein
VGRVEVLGGVAVAGLEGVDDAVVLGVHGVGAGDDYTLVVTVD